MFFTFTIQRLREKQAHSTGASKKQPMKHKTVSVSPHATQRKQFQQAIKWTMHPSQRLMHTHEQLEQHFQDVNRCNIPKHSENCHSTFLAWRRRLILMAKSDMHAQQRDLAGLNPALPTTKHEKDCSLLSTEMQQQIKKFRHKS